MNKVFYNSISELNDFYGVNLELPKNGINKETQLLCYEINGLHNVSFLCEYKMMNGGLYFFREGYDWCHEEYSINNEKELYTNDLVYHNNDNYRYVRVGDHLLKGISDELLGCEFWKQSTGGSNFVSGITRSDDGLYVVNQYGFETLLCDAKFYLNDFDNSLVGYEEFVGGNYLNE